MEDPFSFSTVRNVCPSRSMAHSHFTRTSQEAVHGHWAFPKIFLQCVCIHSTVEAHGIQTGATVQQLTAFSFVIVVASRRQAEKTDTEDIC